MDNPVRESIDQANDSSVELLFTDLELAHTMFHRAELTADAEAKHRNVHHVVRACESIRHFMGKLRLSAEQTQTLSEKLDVLEARVRAFRVEPDEG